MVERRGAKLRRVYRGEIEETFLLGGESVCRLLVSWRPSLLGWRPSLVGWRPSHGHRLVVSSPRIYWHFPAFSRAAGNTPGAACSEVFTGPRLAKVLRPALEHQRLAIEKMERGESWEPLSIHTSAGETFSCFYGWFEIKVRQQTRAKQFFLRRGESVPRLPRQASLAHSRVSWSAWRRTFHGLEAIGL